MAAIRSQVLYIAKYVVTQLGLGSYLPADVSANATSFRVMVPGIFDPAGGTCWELDTDTLITYTGINGDQLTGAGTVPAMKGFTNTSSDVVMISGVLEAETLEFLIDKHRTWVVAEMFEDVEAKRWQANLGWFDTDVVIRDDDDSGYSTISLGGSDTISYERGEVVFATARTESQLFLAGWRYNPYYTLADILTMFGYDDRFLKYHQVGQTALNKPTAIELAAYWRGLGWPYSL